MDEERNFTIEPEDEPPAQSEYTQPDYIPEWKQPTQPEEPEEPKKKRRTWLKITALLLALAIVASLGRALLRSAINGLAAHNASGDSAQPAADASGAASAPESAGEPYQRELTPLPETLPTYDSGKKLTAQEVYGINVDAVCGIATEVTTNVFGQTASTAVVGSGFVLTEDGYVVTNNHVVEGTDNVSVKLHDGSTYPAEVVGGDSLSDVALLKIEAEGLSHVAVGDSDAIAVGEGCIAIGNPLGELTFTMTGGYVSALPREINISGKPISMFQTDAAINAGNSGGPLFDMAGNVIGITSAKISGITGSGASIEGVGFAIPINEALRVVYDLQEYGYVRGRAFLGVTVKELDAATADTYGLPVGPIVQSVVADSCADRAGIAVKDIILRFNGRMVQTYTQLMSALNKCSAGDEVTLHIYRAGAELDVTLTLDERPEEQTVRKVEQGDVDNTEEYSYYYDPDKGE
ncbi:MAG: serine protease HtrA [Clostridia bacterium]|nr:MAG: serine protease HtrA [Clostridia bacterium]